jgi:hypothetical protein
VVDEHRAQADPEDQKPEVPEAVQRSQYHKLILSFLFFIPRGEAPPLFGFKG